MDPLEYAAVSRAQAALTTLITTPAADHRQRAKAFRDAAWAIFRAEPGQVGNALQNHDNPLVQKAAAHALGDALWDNADAAIIAASYLASIAEGSLLDQVKQYARVVPIGSGSVMMASDSVGDVVAEGDPKPVRRLNLSTGSIEPIKAVAILVMTKELANAGGDVGRRMFEAELAATVNRASNRSFLDMLTNSDTIEVAGSSDPLADLRAGLRAAGPSNGYVVAAPAGDVADLATRVENRGGMGVRGGTFVPGVEVVAIDDLVGTHVIPASRIALWDGGVQVRSAEHASVDMRDTPESPANQVSLFQTNSLGLLIERNWHLAAGTELVVVGGAT